MFLTTLRPQLLIQRSLVTNFNDNVCCCFWCYAIQIYDDGDDRKKLNGKVCWPEHGRRRRLWWHKSEQRWVSLALCRTVHFSPHTRTHTHTHTRAQYTRCHPKLAKFGTCSFKLITFDSNMQTTFINHNSACSIFVEYFFSKFIYYTLYWNYNTIDCLSVAWKRL